MTSVLFGIFRTSNLLFVFDGRLIFGKSLSKIRFAEKVKANFLLRGLRNTTDFQLEHDLAAGNRGINKEVETICMFSKPHFATISSSLVRELAMLGERIDQYVLPEIADKIVKKLKIS